jgi:hypothetical protein
VSEHICAAVPHCQFVFTIPKRLRIYFRFERRLLGEVCRGAARTVITVYRAASGRPDAVPGMVGAIQTFGQLIPVHPHIHALVAEGVVLPESGASLPLPKLVTEPFLKLALELHSVVCQFEKATAREAVLGGMMGFQVTATLIVEPGVPCTYR